MSDKVGGFSPDIGLEYIARYQEQSTNLPAQSETKLTGGQIRQRLNELFGGPSLEHTLQRFISPRPSNPAILVPSQFETLVHESANSLHTLAEKSDSPALRSASKLLEQEQELRHLFTNYRNTLKKA